ncbi:hypothetical protein GR160_04305 [Flavobacterium sp. Sd200]|uniref:hypothetical protein n=1 Tax=Flavobacterium sp. Sd200 TaxID=2692211 RepID=UPI001367D50F|nr:hypothetical protein [Flavobacterium sp. Sd200]MXN90440.1 hypothetical protein [Flavobacterium sp. Sd200]
MNDFKLDEGRKIKPGFTTPDGYFDNFTEKLMQQLPERKVKTVPLYKRKPVWFSAAAGFIVMATVGVFYTNSQNPTTPTQPDDAAIENYLVYQANVNSYDLMQHLDQNDIDELEKSITISDDAIEEYLATEDVYSLY